jgi:hypothetical protein
MPSHINGLGAGINAGQLYIQRRRIDNVKDLANLSPEDVSLMNRADGVVANLPRDGFIQVPELKEPNFNAMLLPPEAAHLPNAWDALSWNGKQAPDLNPTPGLSTLVNIGAGAAAPALDRDEPIAISSLPAQFQVLAQRVQLKLNGDSNASTISPNEALNFSTTSFMNGLLPEEKAIVPQMIQAVFDAHNKLHPYATGEIVDVPTLGSALTRLNDAGAAGVVNLKSDTQLTETHRAGYQNLTLARQYSAEVTVPAGSQGLLINTSTGAETKLAAGTTNLGALQPGDYLFEVWKNNVRTDESEFHMPSIPMSESVDLTKDISATLTAGGATLQKSFKSANPAVGVTNEVVYDFTAGGATPVPAGLDLSRTQPQRSALSPGLYKGVISAQQYNGYSRYGSTWTPVTINYALEVRPDGVVNLDLNGSKTMMNPAGGTQYTGAATLNGTTLTLASPYNGAAVAIQPSDRKS